ncbi:MAG TPA: hypothetical protein VHD63_28680, partial [Ktedonobacteraceae bacterium]|nr:hypothetical protein [Ktedonobacteraceae bacterium]
NLSGSGQASAGEAARGVNLSYHKAGEHETAWPHQRGQGAQAASVFPPAKKATLSCWRCLHNAPPCLLLAFNGDLSYYSYSVVYTKVLSKQHCRFFLYLPGW